MREAIQNIQIEYTDFDKLKFPEIIYKFRAANNPLHRTILSNQIVYFAAPNTFEDEFDCRIPERYDLLSDEEIFDEYYKLLRNNNPKWDPIYLSQEVTRHCNMGLLRDKERLDNIEEIEWEQLNERFGVLSLTAIKDNLSMWRKYSNNLNGFCVGFNSKILFKLAGGGGMVNYDIKLPLIHPFDIPEVKRNLLTFYKIEKFAFEEEYRLQKFWPYPIRTKERSFKVPCNAFEELILGANLSEKSRNEIIVLAKAINPKISINVATENNNKALITTFT